MQRFLKLKRVGDDEKGFTLIELMIVVTLMGILAAVVVLNVVPFFQSSEKGAAESELGSVQVAVFAMMADKGFETITGGTVTTDTDLTTAGEEIASFLGAELSKVKGSWTVGEDGYISAGTYPAGASPGWTYTAGATPDEWVYE